MEEDPPSPAPSAAPAPPPSVEQPLPNGLKVRGPSTADDNMDTAPDAEVSRVSPAADDVAQDGRETVNNRYLAA